MDEKRSQFHELIDSKQLSKIQSDYINDVMAIFSSQSKVNDVLKSDRRFSGEEWSTFNPFSSLAAFYVLNSKVMKDLTKNLALESKEKHKIEFLVENWLDSLSPSNFLATNPEAQKKLIESGGKSFIDGVTNFLDDVSKGRISQTDESAFEVGKDLAITPGSVIFENQIAQLIQYSPTTEKVKELPLLIVPPCINKFYIMDLQPESSLVKFAVDSGLTVFLVSWKNAGPQEAKLTWDDYVGNGLIKFIEIVKKITKKKMINGLGFCIGGTLLSSAAAVLKKRNVRAIKSITLMASLIDFEESGVLEIFIDEEKLKFRENLIGKSGLMPGSELASTFSFLRPNDLVWNYHVNNYLKGNKPSAFDLLFWNSDNANLPGPFYCWYLRKMYLENKLKDANSIEVCGERLNLPSVDCPVYAMGAKEDHIVPWKSAFKSASVFSGSVSFVLGASGHIAGCINSAAKNKRSYWKNDRSTKSSTEWISDAKEYPGSWWNDWIVWMKKQSGTFINAPKILGSKEYAEIEPAPGRYVKEEAFRR
tara:strand:- start:28144 stop:29745 length:1602 start_codon:yes stop_codon:yes gene_type:complete